MEHRFTNRLAGSSSIYLLQHAHNPVDWYPWGEEAFQRAIAEQKPVLLSIGYAACHWCHVMERESFEDEQVASFMNKHFINIKIDREERPDLDHIYMDAVQSVTGSGGWPLNVFCTPDKKPFFGGTYFPPERAYNRISWLELLKNIHQAWEKDKSAIVGQAQGLTEHLINMQRRVTSVMAEVRHQDQGSHILQKLLQSADRRYGGFGAAPKFPHTMTIRCLLACAYFYHDQEALKHAELSLQKLIEGGIYDHLGGGMARYSTDAEWKVPHFEKMLYDNALLLLALSDGARLTGNKAYTDAIHKTTRFLFDEMQSHEGGFYAAIDADSEGEEGRFYVWSRQECLQLLGEDAAMICDWYDVTDAGNWEGNNILHVHHNKEEFLAKWELTESQLDLILKKSDQILLEARNKRTRPLTDDKILLGWNGLLVTALCSCFRATGDEVFRENAILLFDFIWSRFNKDGSWKHSYKQGKAEHPAFLDDLAFLIEACIHLQEVTGRQELLDLAEELTAQIIQEFNEVNHLFSYTSNSQADVIFQRADQYDGALPSGNSVMAANLFYLSRMLDKPDWKERARLMLASMQDSVLSFPVSYSNWLILLICNDNKIKELVFMGPDPDNIRNQFLREYTPGIIIQSSTVESDRPLLKNKKLGNKVNIYLCEDGHCLAPVTALSDLKINVASFKS